MSALGIPQGSDVGVALTTMNSSMAKYNVGDIISTTRTDLGSDWLLCDGSAFNTTTYNALYNYFKSIGKTYDNFNYNNTIVTTYSPDTSCIYKIKYINNIYYMIFYNYTTLKVIQSIDFITWTILIPTRSMNTRGVLSFGIVNNYFYITTNEYNNTRFYIITVPVSGGTVETVTQYIGEIRSASEIKYNNGLYYFMVIGMTSSAVCVSCATLSGTYNYAHFPTTITYASPVFYYNNIYYAFGTTDQISTSSLYSTTNLSTNFTLQYSNFNINYNVIDLSVSKYKMIENYIYIFANDKNIRKINVNTGSSETIYINDRHSTYSAIVPFDIINNIIYYIKYIKNSNGYITYLQLCTYNLNTNKYLVKYSGNISLYNITQYNINSNISITDITNIKIIISNCGSTGSDAYIFYHNGDISTLPCYALINGDVLGDSNISGDMDITSELLYYIKGK